MTVAAQSKVFGGLKAGLVYGLTVFLFSGSLTIAYVAFRTAFRLGEIVICYSDLTHYRLAGSRVLDARGCSVLTGIRSFQDVSGGFLLGGGLSTICCLGGIVLISVLSFSR